MGWDRIGDRFSRLKARGEGALLLYLMAGDPDLERSLAYLRAAVAGGADILELGIPFSDPMADGPTIQKAALRALTTGATPKTALDLARSLREESEIPLVIMSYYNPILQWGEEAFTEEAAACGVDGLIVPDLPPEEARGLMQAAEKTGLALIFLVTPESGKERVKVLTECTRGFLYLVARYGTTGAKGALAEGTLPLIRRMLALVPPTLPLVVGFGLSRPEHVREVISAGAAGAVVGSRAVEQVAAGVAPEEFAAFVHGLKEATRI
ncbi:TPA: tryptophan synthase subunit alpha [Candidatus Bipolaricaulota bacterium]|nr:tryptophan synthase subunit alpha [Candidatus Bipolaricaulota bacterium]